MINYDIKFITNEDSLHVKSGDFKSFKYETKKRVEQSVYDSGKRSFCERRGGLWRAPRPRQLRQLESKLRDRTIIACEWISERLVIIVFNSGAIAYLTIKLDTLDITQILFDRYFVGKLSAQTITSVAICKSLILFTHADRIATLVTFGKNNSTSLPCRVADRDPHLQTIELGASTRRTERRISCYESGNAVSILVWSVTNAEPGPWSPTLEDHANLHLYQINGSNINLVAYHQLENDTLSAELSQKWENVVHIVEQVASQKNGVNLHWIRYEVSTVSNRVIKLSSLADCAVLVSLSAPARVIRRSNNDDRLLTACIDGSLYIVHHIAGLTHTTKAAFIATEVWWAGELIIAAEENGRLQCFDRALTLLNHHTKCLDLTIYLRDSRRLKLLATQSWKSGPVILASFTGGPLMLLYIAHPRLLTGWIRARRSSSAVALLRTMDWENEGNQCLWAVNKLVCAALRSGAEAVGEESCAVGALGAYLAPVSPHSPAALRYAPPLHDLARKLFHHLLRRGRLEKALSLGVDLCAWDLFCDARWAARARSLSPLAEEAGALADTYMQVQRQRHDSCSETCSECSSHSYTGSEGETSAYSEVAKTKPPPLPRVPLPTVLPVPISQPEPTSTNSIRPNLHQYLERDSTIWNNDVIDDTYLKSAYVDRLKPILSHNSKWHSLDGLSNYKTTSNNVLSSISEVPARYTNSIIDIPRSHNERLQLSNYKHSFRSEGKETPHTLYRYNKSYHPTTSMNFRGYRNENDNAEKRGNRTERNKVKFSDTITIAVVSDSSNCPDSARELAESLPLCAPHKYLSAFAPHPQPAQSSHAVHPSGSISVVPAAPENAVQKTPKIKVVHFGMV